MQPHLPSSFTSPAAFFISSSTMGICKHNTEPVMQAIVGFTIKNKIQMLKV